MGTVVLMKLSITDNRMTVRFLQEQYRFSLVYDFTNKTNASGS
jgi:hypothetical protein